MEKVLKYPKVYAEHRPHASIVLPAYNEVMNLERVVEEARAAFGAYVPGGEVLIVDDGSVDGTGALADELAACFADVRVLHHAANQGFSGAMATCFRGAQGDWIFLAPADGQMELNELGRFLEAAEHADIVVGVRATRGDGFLRTLLSRSFHRIARTLFDLPQREFSSLFLFRRSALDAMTFRSRPRSATLLPEILFRARLRKLVITELVVQQHPRRGGEAKGGQISVALLTLFELGRLAWSIRKEERRGTGALP